MLKLEDGYAENMGDTLAIIQKDNGGSQHSVIITWGDLEALMGLKGAETANGEAL
ncbi:MAG: hypothetical protein V7676_09500 [Parasphingorhabdus sp.]|uniref:hypothetical protein n=1 Tax=Parasphingorhabdus sp. TaxID=2709688 RepID=UPI003001B6FF